MNCWDGKQNTQSAAKLYLLKGDISYGKQINYDFWGHSALVQLMVENGDCPIAIASSEGRKVMTPVENVHLLNITEKRTEGNKGENLVLIADFTLTDNDGNSMGYFDR